ncbi:centrosomal protein of 126 kDa isoform X5 [Stegostoma tigrinum]|uniref:centrosomal protein of 126 kDa isoform X5 n=1 Tax=Stegostoma tigrinum TaxID=3053191 RepID=UPI00202AC9A9|nr:centrosomal protein of 126 kDa isoform X5 [Stegostoma tigrinum]
MWRDRPVSSVNIKTQLEGLDEERQRLEEEQKTNRAKVRKLTLQTIRRRKALEEKRKDNEEKEQKFREEVLQERKLKQQEATERFQRAHLPPSQRRQNRIGHRKRAIRLEEALEQVQGSSCGSASSSYVIAKSTVNKWTTDLLLNLSPHEIRNGSRYQIQLSEAKAYAKLMQERSGANLQNSRLYFQRELEETQRLLGEQQLNSLQEFQQEIDQLYQSEILSSLDSLETEGQNTTHQTEPIESNSLSVQINHTSNNRVKPHPPVKDSLNSCRTDFYPLKNTHISAWINNLDSSQTSLSSAVVKTNGTEASATKEYLSDKQHTLAFAKIDSECFDSGPLSSVERYQNESSTKLYNNNQHKIIENNAHSIESHPTTRPSSESSLGHTAHSATRPCNAWSTPDPTPREATQVSDVNDRLESVHQNEPVTLHSLKLPLATPFFLNFSPKSQLFSDRRNTDSIKESQKTVEQNHLLACTGATNQINQKADFSSESEGNHASSNKYNLGIKSRHGSEGASQKSAPSQAAFNSSESDSENNVTEGKEKKLAAHSSMSTTRLKTSKNYFYEKSNFNLLKGILKKASKYDNGYPKSVLSATGVLGIQMASSIRDSVELIKMKETESVKNPTKKKLRWFDEIEQTNQFTKVPNKDAGEELEITKDSKSSGSTSQSQVQSPCSENNGSFTNGDARNYLSSRNNGHKTNLQHHRTNVSQLSIDGSTLMNGMRSVSRGDRLLSAPSVAFTRRNHPTDTHSSGIKYRALLEQRRMNIGSTTHKSDQIGQNFQISPFPSAFDPVQTINAAQNSEEVSQSTEQFMLAENMVETSAQDSDILSAMETIETQQYSFLQNKVQRLGLSALSFEEQKLLQSLDRLDKRLQYIKEIVQTSPSDGLLQIPSPFVISNGASSSSTRPEQVLCDTQKDHSFAPDNYGKFQRKY